jgi:WD40 repeat protein
MEFLSFSNVFHIESHKYRYWVELCLMGGKIAKVIQTDSWEDVQKACHGIYSHYDLSQQSQQCHEYPCQPIQLCLTKQHWVQTMKSETRLNISKKVIFNVAWNPLNEHECILEIQGRNLQPPSLAVFNIQTGQKIKTLPDCCGIPKFHGSDLVVIYDNRVKVWDSKDWTLKEQLHVEPRYSALRAEYSPFHDCFLALNQEMADICLTIWGMSPLRCIRTISDSNDHEFDEFGEDSIFKFHSKNSLLLVVINDFLDIWDTQNLQSWTKKQEFRLSSCIQSIEFHPTQNVFVVGYCNGNILVFEEKQENWELIQKCSIDCYPVWSLRFDPTGQFLVSAWEDNTLGVFDYREGTLKSIQQIRKYRNLQLEKRSDEPVLHFHPVSPSMMMCFRSRIILFK